tara:strand:+ start:1559 stop:1717 length:159 start_codon:yes stop_codon:yes gene_type:complete
MKTLRKDNEYKRVTDSTKDDWERIKKLTSEGWEFIDKATWKASKRRTNKKED